jgi:hypothetical protein
MNLQNLINPELWLKVENNAVTLKEENNTDNQTLRAVTIRDLPPKVFVFSTDKAIEITTNKLEKRRNQFLNNENDKINKNCDAVIIHIDNNNLHIACCELKSKNPIPIQYETQLINAQVFVEYLVALFNRFYKDEPKLKIKNVWYILFYMNRAIRIPKTTRSEAQPVKETMKNYSETIIKYKCSRTMYNNIKWDNLINS